ncbi:hypothetical protein COCNU_scaffold000005G000010 [Cocos nucifera]|nr:hypothetical protein [Cocos nucifera]
MERKKKKAVSKKVGRKVKSSEGEDLSQEQGSLDDREVIQALMEESILPHIVERMHQKDDIESWHTANYPFAHSEMANQRWAEASRALEEAYAEAEKAQAKVDALKVASKTHSSVVKCLKELREESKEMAKLRAELALEKEERRKAQEEVSAIMGRAVQDFKSSKDMEDIKIDFA